MKKTFFALCLIAIMALASTAMATTWTGTSLGPNTTPFAFGIGGNGDTFHTTLSLIPDGFTVGDTVLLAGLVLDFDNAGTIKSVKLDDALKQQNFFTLGGLDFLLVPNNDLSDGLLKLDITAKDATAKFLGHELFPGDITLESICLTAVGCDNTPVPEPGTMMLLGAGFLGLAVYGKRRKSA